MISIPHGGRLVRRLLQGEEREQTLAEAATFPRHVIDDETAKDAKNIARGVLSPLQGFMTKLEAQNVVDDSKLPSGEAWTIPVLLDADRAEAGAVKEGDRVLLVDESLTPVAILHLEEKFELDRKKLVQSVFKTDDPAHPGVADFYSKKEVFLGGKIDLVDLSREPFPELNRDPVETRELFHDMGWRTVVGFQTRNPVHRAHEYIQKCALEIVDGLFINPVIG
jgi:sulfate adenylyltransferase